MEFNFQLYTCLSGIFFNIYLTIKGLQVHSWQEYGHMPDVEYRYVYKELKTGWIEGQDGPIQTLSKCFLKD